MISSSSSARFGCHRSWCAVLWYRGRPCDCDYTSHAIDSGDKSAPASTGIDPGHGNQEGGS